MLVEMNFMVAALGVLVIGVGMLVVLLVPVMMMVMLVVVRIIRRRGRL